MLTGSQLWVQKSQREQRYSRSAARSTTPVLLRSLWGLRCVRLSTISAAASPTARNSRRLRPAVLQADVFLHRIIDTPIDYDNLIAIGSMMGSGGLIVMDEDNCMVDIAKFFLEFTVDESCGKCTPCRIGTKRLLRNARKDHHRARRPWKISTRLEELCYYIKNIRLCAVLGQTAPNPVLSTLRYFRDEYIAHVKRQEMSCRRMSRCCSRTEIDRNQVQAAVQSLCKRLSCRSNLAVLIKQPPTASIRQNVSSAVLVWLSVSSVQLLRNDPV